MMYDEILLSLISHKKWPYDSTTYKEWKGNPNTLRLVSISWFVVKSNEFGSDKYDTYSKLDQYPLCTHVLVYTVVRHTTDTNGLFG